MIRLRRATPEDADAIARVHIASWRAAYRGIVPDAFLDGLQMEARAERWRKNLAGESLNWVAEDGGGVVGFCSAGRCRDADLPGFGEIYALYVVPEWWSRGAGRALLERAIAETSYPRLSLWVLERNDRARRFYERAGFQVEEGVREIEIGGARLPEVRYRKEVER